MSERCFRFKPDALPSHAPPKPGVYEFVTFDAGGTAKVLYVGLSQSVYQSLSDHLANKAEPTADELFAAAKDVYFDYVADADIDSIDDLEDIAGAFIAKHKPPFNSGEAPSSGKYAAVEIQELD
jgi:excinuclease UvrABC nuclease subunit